MQSVSRPLVGPTNLIDVLQAAGTAYTAEDIPLALAIRLFLMTIDLIGDDEESLLPTGIMSVLGMSRTGLVKVLRI